MSINTKKIHQLLALFLSTTTLSFADFKDDIDFTKLKNKYGSALPDGANVKLAQIEYVRDGNWMPSATDDLAGKSLMYMKPFGGTSQHANEVGAYLGGTTTSITPNIPGWHCFEATSYYLRGSLWGGSCLEPQATNWDVENHSWGGTTAFSFINVMRKLDYRIARDNICVIAAVDNGPNLSLMLSNAYNMISVGTSTGNHPHSGTTCEVPGRRKPDLVGTSVWTSYAAPIVSSCASLLIGKIKDTPYLSEARNPMVIKALLMAGATKSEFPGWSNSPTQPLDIIYGAGEVNIFNSYETLIAGRQHPQQIPSTLMGWDNNSTTGTTHYYITVPAGKTINLSAVLTWHRRFSNDSTWLSMPVLMENLDLQLHAADAGFNVGAPITESKSAVDNVEHIYAKSLSAGNYVLSVCAPNPGERYGIAWSSEIISDTNPQPAIDTPQPPPPPPAAPVISSFTADTNSIFAGNSVTLSWSTANASSLSLSPGVGDVFGLSSITVPPSSTTNYVLTASGPGGTTSSSFQVSVSTPPPPPAAPVISSFTADTNSIFAGNSVTLSWSTANASSLSLSPGIGDVSNLTSLTLSPSSSTDYVLTASGPGGTTSSSFQVSVSTPPPPPPPPPAPEPEPISPKTPGETFGQLQVSADIGAVLAAGSTSYDLGTDTLSLSGAGSDITRFSDGFRFAAAAARDDFELSASILSLQSIVSNTKAGLMIRADDQAGSINCAVVIYPQNYVSFTFRSKTGFSTVFRTALTASRPTALKLSRRGANISAYYSLDGTVWATLGTIDLNIGSDVLAGAILTSAGTSSPATVQFQNTRLSALAPSASYDGLSLYDIGISTEVANFSTDTNGAVTLHAIGSPSISNGRDACAFLAKPSAGDGAIATSLTSFGSTTSNRVGLMYRESLADASSRVFLGYDQLGQLILETRYNTSGAKTSQVLPHTGRHLILDRRGNNFTALASYDGINWTTLASVSLSMSSNAWVGLTANSNESTTKVSVTFSDFIQTF